MRILTPILAAPAVAAMPAAASASTITLEGDTLVLRAAPGEKNWLTVGPDDYAPGRLQFSDIGQPTSYPSSCTPCDRHHVRRRRGCGRSAPGSSPRRSARPGASR